MVSPQIATTSPKPSCACGSDGLSVATSVRLFHPDPEASSDFDYVVCECTYGGRNRVRASGTKRRALLAREVNAALDNDGVLVIPSFAVERQIDPFAVGRDRRDDAV